MIANKTLRFSPSTELHRGARMRLGLWSLAPLVAMSLGCGNLVQDERAPSLTTSAGGAIEGSGGLASGGGSGGTPSVGGSGASPSAGGAAGSSTGGQASGGMPGLNKGEFVLSLPRGQVFGMGHPLVATPHGSVLTSASKAPPGWLTDAVDSAILAEISASGELLQVLALGELGQPSLIAVDSAGSIFLAGGLIPDATTHFLSFELKSTGTQAYLIKLASDFSPLHAEVSAVFGESEYLAAMSVDAAGDLIIASALHSAEGLQFIQRPRMSKFSGETLLPAWSTLMNHTDPQGYPRDVTVLPDGTAVAGGAYHGELTLGQTVLPRLGPENEPGVSAAWLGWFAPETGSPSWAEAIGGEQSHYAHGLETTSTGNLRVLGAFTGAATVFGQSMDFGMGRVALFELNAQREVEWFTPIEHTVDFYAHALALGSQDQSYLVGRSGDRFGEPSQMFARLLRVEADGTIGQHFDLLTGNGNGATTIAVDSLGGVWMSAAWEAPFEFGGTTYTPEPGGCQFILRKAGF